MKHTLFILVCVGGIAGIFQGCTPDPLQDLSVDDSKVYITNHDNSVNFASYITFSMADSVRVIDNGQADWATDDPVPALVTSVVQNLTSRGYTRIDRNASPDLGVTISYVRDTRTGVIANPSPYYDPFYWGYGGAGYYYPTYYSYYQVSTAYWYVELVDLKNVAQNNNQIKVIWSAQIRGDGLLNEPARMVNALFAQSPYLVRN